MKKKITTDTATLRRALEIVNRVIAPNPIVPILENVLFDLRVGQLTLTGSNLNIVLNHQITAEGDDARFAVPAADLLKLLKQLPAGPVELHYADDTFAVDIVYDRKKYRFAGENPADWPKAPVVTNADEFTLDGNLLHTGLSASLISVSTDWLRPSMTGVLLRAAGGQLTMCATNGHTLSTFRADTDATFADLILPAKAAAIITNLFTTGDVLIRTNGKHLVATSGDTGLCVTLIDERYPDYENALPTNSPTTAELQSADLSAALARVMIFANHETSAVAFTFRPDSLTVSAEDMDYGTEASEPVALETYDGPEGFRIGLSAKLLSGLIAKFPGTLRFQMSTANRGVLITPTDDRFLLLCMPLMLADYHLANKAEAATA